MSGAAGLRLSVIVPALDEERQIATTLAAARQPGVAEVIVVDGGSRDRTRACALPYADRVIDAPRGRARQMNAGAASATGDVLLFVHADTRLPPDAAAAVVAVLADPAVVGGHFDVHLEPSSPSLRMVAAMLNLRSRVTRIATGDQAIFVRADALRRLGGFPDLPLMEDVAFSRALRRAGRVACLRARVTTSSRRWRQQGVWSTVVQMWTLRLLFFLGVPAARLARWYGAARDV